MTLFGPKYKNSKSKQARSVFIRTAPTTAPSRANTAVASQSYGVRTAAQQAPIHHAPTAQPIENTGYTMRQSMRNAPPPSSRHCFLQPAPQPTPQPPPPHTQRPVVSQSVRHNHIQPWMGALTLPADIRGPSIFRTTMRHQPAPGTLIPRHPPRGNHNPPPRIHPHRAPNPADPGPNNPCPPATNPTAGNTSFWTTVCNFLTVKPELTTSGREYWERDAESHEDIHPARPVIGEGSTRPAYRPGQGKQAYNIERRTQAAQHERRNQWRLLDDWPRHSEAGKTCNMSSECEREVGHYEYHHSTQVTMQGITRYQLDAPREYVVPNRWGGECRGSVRRAR